MTESTDTETGVAQGKAQRIGGPSHIDTLEKPCPNCGIVQEMKLMEQLYDGAPTHYYVDRHCPVCSHHIEEVP